MKAHGTDDLQHMNELHNTTGLHGTTGLHDSTGLHQQRALLWALLAGFSLAWLYLLGVRTLVPPDEGRYAEMAREMLVSGDWITTRLNGIKYFEKPPLQTWMNALSFAAFGLGEWQARLWTGLCGLGGIVLTGYAGARVFGARIGVYAALVLGSCFYWVASGQVDSLDMGLSGMMTLALCALLIGQRDGAGHAERRRWMLVCWAAMALSVLAKGLIGLMLPGAVLVLYTLATRDWALWSRLHLGKGLLLFFAVAAPWFVLVALRNPEQPHFFFVHEHWDRFFLKTHHREAAWWIFFALSAIGMVPWLGLLPQALGLGAKDARGPGAGGARSLLGAGGAPGLFRPRLLLLIWAVFIVLFWTKSNSKLPGYILPIFPALALLVACQLASGARGGRVAAAALTAAIGVALLAAVPFMTRLPHPPGETGLLQAFQPWIIGAGFTALVGGALALIYARQMQRDLFVLVLAAAGFVSTELILAGFEPYGAQRAGLPLVAAIKKELRPDTRIYSVGIYEQSLTFYLQRTVTLVDYVDEFAFGLQQQPELAIPNVADFVVQWRRNGAAGVHELAIVAPAVYLTLQQQGVPMRVVAQDARRVVVANESAP